LRDRAGFAHSFYFRYEQPELVDTKEELVRGLGNVKVQWSFTGSKVSCEFAYTVRQQVTLDNFRYVLCIGAPHSRYRLGNSPVLGPLGHRCTVHKNDFQAVWQETEVVSNDPTYRTNYGRIHYLQFLRRDHPLVMRPGNVYRSRSSSIRTSRWSTRKPGEQPRSDCTRMPGSTPPATASRAPMRRSSCRRPR